MKAEDTVTMALTDVYEKGFKAGIKEVVEWINAKLENPKDSEYWRIWFLQKEWQAKLKEWELE